MGEQERGEHDRRVARRLEEGSDVILRGEGLDEVRRLSEDELMVRHDACMVEAYQADLLDLRMLFIERAQRYAAELTRKENARQGKRMEALTRSLNRLTWWIVGLTVLIAIATLVGVGLTAWTLLSGA
jgi:hypothetical protein